MRSFGMDVNWRHGKTNRPLCLVVSIRSLKARSLLSWKSGTGLTVCFFEFEGTNVWEDLGLEIPAPDGRWLPVIPICSKKFDEVRFYFDEYLKEGIVFVEMMKHKEDQWIGRESGAHRRKEEINRSRQI